MASKDHAEDDEDESGGARDWAGSIAGSDSEASVSGYVRRRRRPRKRGKVAETMAEMIERIKRFMKVGVSLTTS